ncbi:MAG: ABC transporter permease [Actinomycetia bacterium]|nr:ABC transporter permease [Actinomycetes bacterium]
MRQLLLRKLVELIVVLFVVTLVSFLLLSLVPGGNPAVRMLGDQATPEAVAELRAELGLDDPLPTRYLRWLGDVLRGDLGRSIDLNQDVADVLREKVPITIELAALSIGIGVLFAVPLGIVSAWKAGTRLDKVITSTSFAVLSLPSFLIAIVLLILFAVRWKILPATPAWVPITEAPLTNLKNLILPVSAMAIGEIAVLTRVLRSDMIEVLQSNFIEAARAKGMSNRYILTRHALPASLTSMLTLIGLQIAGALTGAVIIEQIFGLPGLGRTLLLAISRRDLVLVQGMVLIVAASYVIVNSLVDLTYRMTDPRLRHG